MKIARYLSIGMLGFFVATIRTSADSTGSDPAGGDSAVIDPDLNPYTQTDPDGVPLAVTHPPPQPLSQAQINAVQKQLAQAKLDKDWLVRNYEKQVQVRAARSSEDQSTNLYYQLSSNKELAKLAGLPALDSDDQDNPTVYRMGTPPSGHGSGALRADTSSASMRAFSSRDSLLKPLITPLSAPDAAGLHNFYSSPSFSIPSPIPGGLSKTPPAPRTNRDQESSDIETPGMVAAEKNQLMDTSAPNLTLDILPGESIEQFKAHQDNNNNLELPLLKDAAQLHKEQAAALSPPGVQNAAQTATPPPVKEVPIDDSNAPLPVDKAPQINPVRSPIANPYDILNR